jgi:hypothetical protein
LKQYTPEKKEEKSLHYVHAQTSAKKKIGIGKCLLFSTRPRAGVGKKKEVGFRR